MTLILNFFIESSKTDQYREGTIVPIVKSGTDLCPWSKLEKYLSLAKLTLPTSSQGGDDYLFGNIQTKSGSQSIHSGSKLSCTRCREVLLKKIADVGILSLSLGTASEVAVHLPPLMVVSLKYRLVCI